MSKQLSLDEIDALHKLRIRYADCKHQYEIDMLQYMHQFGDVKIRDQPSRIRQILQHTTLLSVELSKVKMEEMDELIKKIVDKVDDRTPTTIR